MSRRRIFSRNGAALVCGGGTGAFVGRRLTSVTPLRLLLQVWVFGERFLVTFPSFGSPGRRFPEGSATFLLLLRRLYFCPCPLLLVKPKQ